MQADPDVSTIAALIGDPTRAAILSALMDGQSLPASDLASRAHVTFQTTSSHLAKLVEGGLLEVKQFQRHRYYRIKNAEVAHALEALAVISPLLRPKSVQRSAGQQALCTARTCYDHLAGKLGVAVSQALLAQKFLLPERDVYHLTPTGMDWLAAWDIDEKALYKGRRKFAYPCLDWSERQPHIAGTLGAAVAAKFFEKGWVKRLPETRAIQLTDAGRKGLAQELALTFVD